MSCSKSNVGVDVEDLDHSTKHLDTKDIYRTLDPIKARDLVKEMISQWKKFPWENKKEYNLVLQNLKKKFSIAPNHVQMNYAYRQLIETRDVDIQSDMEKYLSYKNVRHNSGVCVVALITSPGSFSCPEDCYYCPDEPGQPRSYLSREPAMIRANENGFDACRQFWSRATCLALEGHPVDKVEILVLGGTWSNYPLEYQETYIRDLYYAANQFYVDRDNRRERYSLEKEIKINETTICRVIGITLETRPDFITKEEIIRFRRYNVTRVQIGIQHTDDSILKKINRGCYTKDAIECLRLLKNNGYKIDIHLMPDLPFSTSEKDMIMFKRVLEDPNLQADQWKIYPCEVTPFTVIEKWFNEGKHVPYEPEVLMDLLVKVMPKIHPWIRVNRVIRDIPVQYHIGGNGKTNLRQDVETEMKKQGVSCRDIRSREVRQNKDALEKAGDAELVTRTYPASDGTEIFLSFETEDHKTIYGFLRLRFPPKENPDCVIEELQTSTAFVRELHVYGLMNPTTKRGDETINVQSLGFGKRLMARAEEMAIKEGYNKLAVISGVGVRQYYQKLGYHLFENFMIKDLPPPPFINLKTLILIIIYFIGLLFAVLYV